MPSTQPINRLDDSVQKIVPDQSGQENAGCENGSDEKDGNLAEEIRVVSDVR